MSKKNKEGQPQDCPKVAAPVAGEILRLLRGLTPEKRRQALELLRRLEEGARNDLR